MNHQRTLTRYQESQILNASPEQLLLLTYDGLLRFLGRAKRGMESRDFDEKHVGVSRSQTIVLELYRTLNHDAAPELAANLARVYVYLLEEVARADLEDDAERLGRVIGIVSGLRETWLEAARSAQVTKEGEGWMRPGSPG